MPMKYYCPKCSKRWVEWGAQKVEFKCPEPGCDSVALLRVGVEPGAGGEARPTLKRRKREEFIPVPGLEDMKDNLGSAEPEELLDFGDDAGPAAIDVEEFDE